MGYLGNVSDPCLPANHKILSETWRSVENAVEATNGSHCDNTIPTGWFRMRLGGKDAIMPTECVEVGKTIHVFRLTGFPLTSLSFPRTTMVPTVLLAKYFLVRYKPLIKSVNQSINQSY